MVPAVSLLYIHFQDTFIICFFFMSSKWVVSRRKNLKFHTGGMLGYKTFHCCTFCGRSFSVIMQQPFWLILHMCDFVFNLFYLSERLNTITLSFFVSHSWHILFQVWFSFTALSRPNICWLSRDQDYSDSLHLSVHLFIG